MLGVRCGNQTRISLEKGEDGYLEPTVWLKHCIDVGAERGNEPKKLSADDAVAAFSNFGTVLLSAERRGSPFCLSGSSTKSTLPLCVKIDPNSC